MTTVEVPYSIAAALPSLSVMDITNDVSREVAAAGISSGIAFLHTLRRNPEQVVRPFMVLGRSTAGVDFDALDGGLTHLFFVLGLKFDELYLPWLHKLSQMFAQQDAVKAILDAPDGQAIFDAVARAERRIEPEIRTATAVRHG